MDKTVTTSMENIFGMSKIFKVICTIIGFWFVNVVNLKSIWARAKECFCHEDVYPPRETPPIPSKNNAEVSSVIRARFQNFPNPCSGGGTRSSYSSQIGNLVGVEARNLLPDFSGRIDFRHDGSQYESLCSGPQARGNASAARLV